MDLTGRNKLCCRWLARIRTRLLMSIQLRTRVGGAYTTYTMLRSNNKFCKRLMQSCCLQPSTPVDRSGTCHLAEMQARQNAPGWPQITHQCHGYNILVYGGCQKQQ
jgi:hypothetical protein